MAKIAIFEDSVDDVFCRYGPLVKEKEHDVHIYLTEQEVSQSEGLEKLGEYLLKYIKLEPDKLHCGFPESPMDADIYFVDGLAGKCFEIMEALPKEKVCLLSMEDKFIGRARNEGYKTITPSFNSDYTRDQVNQVVQMMLGK